MFLIPFFPIYVSISPVNGFRWALIPLDADNEIEKTTRIITGIDNTGHIPR